MAKLNRPIDKETMEASKQRTMAFIMDEIERERIPVFRHILHALFRPKRLAVLASAIVIALLIIFNPGGSGNPGNDNPNYQISAETSDQLAELSYISSHLVTMEMSVSDTDLMFLADTETTALEDNMTDFNQYFDMLKVYLDDNSFSESTTFTTLTDSEYQYQIEFNQDDLTYTLLLNEEEDNTFTGIMTLDGVTLNVTGTIEENNNESHFEFEATNGTDEVYIEYETEADNEESEKAFSIHTNINGNESNKDISVEKESDEWKVEIGHNQDRYELKKELEDGVWQYKLEYQVNGKNGEARITETVDSEGNPAYNYRISEEGVNRNIEVGKPDFAGRGNNPNNNQDDENNSSNPNNDDDTPGNKPDDIPNNNTNQSYDDIIDPAPAYTL